MFTGQKPHHRRGQSQKTQMSSTESRLRTPPHHHPTPENICSTVITFVLHVEGMKREDTGGERGDVGHMQCFTGLRVDANGALVPLSREGLGIHICREGVFTGGLEMR